MVCLQCPYYYSTHEFACQCAAAGVRASTCAREMHFAQIRCKSFFELIKLVFVNIRMKGRPGTEESCTTGSGRALEYNGRLGTGNR